MNLRSVLSNKNNTECCGINITTKREGLQTLWRGLPPRLIASRRLRLRYLVGDGFAVRIPLLLCARSPPARQGKDEQTRSGYEVNPSLSADEAYKKLIINLVGFFCAQKDAPKMHRLSFYALLRVFFKSHISHTAFPIFSLYLTAQNGACNFSPILVKKNARKKGTAYVVPFYMMI